MANPATLKPKPFKKGKDPRRYKKRKGDISLKRRFLEDYKRWCKEKGMTPEKKALELFDRLDKMSKKNFPALKEWLERIYGKEPEKVEGELKVNIINYGDIDNSIQVPAKVVSTANSAKQGKKQSSGNAQEVRKDKDSFKPADSKGAK